VKTFYFVWNQTGHVPSYKHDTFEEALKEAERIISQETRSAYRADELVILKSVCVVKRLPGTVVEEMEDVSEA